MTGHWPKPAGRCAISPPAVTAHGIHYCAHRLRAPSSCAFARGSANSSMGWHPAARTSKCKEARRSCEALYIVEHVEPAGPTERGGSVGRIRSGVPAPNVLGCRCERPARTSSLPTACDRCPHVQRARASNPDMRPAALHPFRVGSPRTSVEVRWGLHAPALERTSQIAQRSRDTYSAHADAEASDRDAASYLAKKMPARETW